MKHLRPVLSVTVLAVTIPALLAACAGTATAPEPTPSPTASARPAPAPAPAASAAPAPAGWADRPLSTGDWTLREGDGFVTAGFGESASEPRFALRCNLANRQIAILRAGEIARPQPLVIRTETRAASLQAGPQEGGEPLISALLPASDPLFDAIAFSRGKFAVESQGLSTLVLPPWGEVSRVIEACR